MTTTCSAWSRASWPATAASTWCSARNGHDAVGLAERLDADLVVMDIELPVCDGAEATRLLRESAPGVQVVAISGHDYEERVLEIGEAGAADYVRKSRIGDDLIAVLESLVERS